MQYHDPRVFDKLSKKSKRRNRSMPPGVSDDDNVRIDLNVQSSSQARFKRKRSFTHSDGDFSPIQKTVKDNRMDPQEAVKKLSKTFDLELTNPMLPLSQNHLNSMRQSMQESKR